MDSFVAKLLAPLAAWVLLSGLDDLFVLACYLRRALHPPRLPASTDLTAEPESRIAIFVPLWHEDAVIARMLERNLAAIRYRHYDFFVGVYPNDTATRQAVAQIELRFPRVHKCLVPHDGPTSKADCLNAIYRGMLAWESESGERFDIVLTHDAEDLIHPDGLLLANYYATRCDMIQTPVLALQTPLNRLTHGFYCDDFAEFHGKDLPVRSYLGGFIPSSGVGTSYTRSALETLAQSAGGAIFRADALTEDYENGLRLHQCGRTQGFVDCPPIATREYFPRSFRSALRQRTRWVTGIALQGWQRHGWSAGRHGWYWLWRDRKGLAGNPLSLLANAIFLYGAATWTFAHATHRAWNFGAAAVARVPPACLVATAALAAFQLLVRACFSAKVYGWKFAVFVPVRAAVGNVLNALATVWALFRFARATILHQPLRWLKTDHTYPDLPAIGLGTLQPVHVPLQVARALPLHLVRQWRVLPIAIESGSLNLAISELPGDGLEAELRRYTALRLRFTVVSARNFEDLCKQLL